MAEGFESSRALFGNDSEAYVSSLFKMARNPNGSRRPDLLSINGRLTPKLSIELKSSTSNRGSMVDAQLHYGITTGRDYKELFGEEMPDLEEGNLFSQCEKFQDQSPNGKRQVAYYYGLIKRLDGLKLREVQEPYSEVRLKWGDITLVPHHFAFASYAVQRSMKTGEPIEEVLKNLREVILRQARGERAPVKGYETSRYIQGKDDRRTNPNGWFDLHGRDILAIYNETEEELDDKSKKRIELMRKAFPSLEKLVKISEIDGPNKSVIRVLAEPTHQELFDLQLRRIVLERKEAIEKISKRREEASRFLEGLRNPEEQIALISNECLPQKKRKRYGLKDIPREKRKYLDRLRKWLRDNEEEFSDFHVPF